MTRGPAIVRGVLAGAAAGAAGTAVLNAVTYLDMAVRGRPASSAPEQTVDTLADRAGLDLPGEGERRDNRRSGLGSLSGIATGVVIGAAFGALRSLGLRPPAALAPVLAGVAAMAATDLPMARLGVTDPRTWSRADWLSDLVPHLAYGAATCATLAALDRQAGGHPASCSGGSRSGS